MSARNVLAAGLAAALVGVAGCSGSLVGGGAGGTDPAAPKTGATVAAAPAAPGVDAEAFRNPLASVEVPMPLDGDQAAKVKVDLLGLKRQGKVLNLTAAITPTTTLSEDFNLYELVGKTTWKPRLVDVENLKLYSVVANSSGGTLQSESIGDRVPAGAPLLVYAIFAAPPGNVSAINVQVADQIPAFENVPIG
jgi:hypothetical protein